MPKLALGHIPARVSSIRRALINFLHRNTGESRWGSSADSILKHQSRSQYDGDSRGN
ncbi:hypothetical protein BN126310254 [Stenotrophomonas thermophila]|nr:hypothetical protein BN126310254 [Stenotrophomonas maltophilia]